jgi:hypothetical protein
LTRLSTLRDTPVILECTLHKTPPPLTSSKKATAKQTTMSRSTDPGHFFQTDASESTRARRAAKSGNKNGNPIVLQSKILNVIPDPLSSACIYIAESASCVRKVNVEVGMITVERVWKMGC